MTEKVTRTRICDQCGTDLTRTCRTYGWHYTLSGSFTPSDSCIGYDPHPEPPEDLHFCDEECLARHVGVTFGHQISSEMFDAGGKVIAETGEFGTAGNYASQRKLAIAVFKAMWAARDTSLGRDEKKELPDAST